MKHFILNYVLIPGALLTLANVFKIIFIFRFHVTSAIDL